FFKLGIIFFCVLIFVYGLKITGILNFLYLQKLKRIANANFEIFNNFIDNKVKTTRTISSDTIVQSSLIQSDNHNILMDSFKHLNLYKQNFGDIRSITIFNFLYNIVLTSEVEEYIINQNLSKEWFLNSLSRGYYISDISYDYTYNEFIISIINPINNIVDENVGFLMIDFSLSELFEKIAKNKGTVVLLKKQDKVVFNFPLDYKIKKDVMLSEQFSFYIEKNWNGGYTFITAAGRQFLALPGFIKILLILLFTLLLFLVGSFGMQWYSQKIERRNEQFKSMTSDIVALSKDIEIQNLKDDEKKDAAKKADKTFINERKESENIENMDKEKPIEQTSSEDGFRISK
ncbi:MAG: cache domain-containing protein, partial [Spirochaetes bacterium]|nr:cache domain-containing protein [Spirochaetota bacterium]